MVAEAWKMSPPNQSYLDKLRSLLLKITVAPKTKVLGNVSGQLFGTTTQEWAGLTCYLLPHLVLFKTQGKRKATCCFLNPNLNFISHNPFKFKWAMQRRRKAGSRYGSIWCCLAGSNGRVCLSQCDANHIIYIMINLVLTTPTSEATTSHQNCSMADLGEADCTLLGLHISSASIGLRQLRDVVTAILLSFTLGEINVSVEQEKNQT